MKSWLLRNRSRRVALSWRQRRRQLRASPVRNNSPTVEDAPNRDGFFAKDLQAESITVFANHLRVGFERLTQFASAIDTQEKLKRGREHGRLRATLVAS